MHPPEIRTLSQKKLTGKRLTMRFSDNRTHELWQSFMPEKKLVKNAVGNDLFSLQIYPPGFGFDPANFDADTSFEKWAAIEVSSFEDTPAGMETLIIPTGLYAVFQYKGAADEAERSFWYIFSQWLPSSRYSLDHRPHFELLGEKYKNNDPASEEEIWIPIKPKP